MLSPATRLTQWRVATALWIGLIFFSCTTVAGQWSEHAYIFLKSVSNAYLKADVAASDLVHFLAEKSVHVVLFFVLAILLWKAIPDRRLKVTSILLIGFAVGSSSELLQRLFPGRDPSLRDIAIDVGASATGCLVCWLLLNSRPEP
jgi:VanZ family protein